MQHEPYWKMPGEIFAATLITPCMPMAICGNANASSPLTTRKSEGRSRNIMAHCAISPPASLIPAILGNSARRTIRCRHLHFSPFFREHYKQTGLEKRLSNCFVVLIESFLRRLAVVGTCTQNGSRVIRWKFFNFMDHFPGITSTANR